MAESEACEWALEDSITVNTVLQKGVKRCSGCGLEQGIAKKTCKNQNCSMKFPIKEKDLEPLKNMSNINIMQQRKRMEKRADILNIHKNCDIVILMHHKHGSGDTLTYYGTEGAGVSFIGNKSTIETSESGRVALNLFRKFIEDFKENESLSQLQQQHSELQQQQPDEPQQQLKQPKPVQHQQQQQQQSQLQQQHSELQQQQPDEQQQLKQPKPVQHQHQHQQQSQLQQQHSELQQ